MSLFDPLLCEKFPPSLDFAAVLIGTVFFSLSFFLAFFLSCLSASPSLSLFFLYFPLCDSMSSHMCVCLTHMRVYVTACDTRVHSRPSMCKDTLLHNVPRRRVHKAGMCRCSPLDDLESPLRKPASQGSRRLARAAAGPLWRRRVLGPRSRALILFPLPIPQPPPPHFPLPNSSHPSLPPPPLSPSHFLPSLPSSPPPLSPSQFLPSLPSSPPPPSPTLFFPLTSPSLSEASSSPSVVVSRALVRMYLPGGRGWAEGRGKGAGKMRKK